mmetsp:Transcript_9227/g.13379  ORF Transcript_9227/g.13379 Transcript_9227/m.13379 type:complete len:126 (+) Transcript_9227:323-700(+)
MGSGASNMKGSALSFRQKLHQMFHIEAQDRARASTTPLAVSRAAEVMSCARSALAAAGAAASKAVWENGRKRRQRTRCQANERNVKQNRLSSWTSQGHDGRWTASDVHDGDGRGDEVRRRQGYRW